MPPAWSECRRCGAGLDAPAPAARASAVRVNALASLPPPPPSTSEAAAIAPERAEGFGAPDDALLPGRPPPTAGPDTMLPTGPPLIIERARDRRPSRWNGRTIAIVAVVVAAAGAGALTLRPHRGGPASQPTVLAPRAPFAGIPTSLEDVVRIAAESARHTALSTVMSTAGSQGVAVTTSELTAAQPDYQWVPETQPSTTDTTVSVASRPGLDVIAVAGTNKSICAFARWSPTEGATYVTMDHDPACAAADAPGTGWSTVAGGSAQDLPLGSG